MLNTNPTVRRFSVFGFLVDLLSSTELPSSDENMAFSCAYQSKKNPIFTQDFSVFSTADCQWTLNHSYFFQMKNLSSSTKVISFIQNTFDSTPITMYSLSICLYCFFGYLSEITHSAPIRFVHIADKHFIVRCDAAKFTKWRCSSQKIKHTKTVGRRYLTITVLHSNKYNCKRNTHRHICNCRIHHFCRRLFTSMMLCECERAWIAHYQLQSTCK